MPKSKPTVAFTKKSLDALKPSVSRFFRYDAKTPGLCVAVLPSGVKTFYVYRRIGVKPERIRIGRYPEITPEQARRQAEKINGMIAEGVNPNDQKRGRRAEPTIGELWEAFERFVAKRRKAKTVHDYRLLYARHLKRWAGRKLSEIKRADVARLHSAVGEDAPFAANRLLALVSSMFNRGHLVGWHGESPTRGVERFRERSRDRYLNAEELPRFLEALNADPSHDARDFFTVCLFTGARRGNVQRMKWPDVDLKAGTWTIDADDAKGGETVAVYLPEFVVDTLLRRKAEQGQGATWVFPAKGKTGHLVDPMPWWRRVCTRAGLVDHQGKPTLRVHDLRRSFGSWQAANGASLQIIGKSLGHRNQATTAVYSRLDLNPIKVSVDSAVTAMLNAAGAGDGEGVAGRIGKSA